MAGGPELEPLGRRQAAPDTRLPTTLSTIAVQSGTTRIIIALLQNCEWVELKVLEMTPELTQLGQNLEEALLLQEQHDQVLQKLASKQSPVEELLNQADQLIANQKPKAEVYSAMAESLGLAWRDLNAQLETRRQLLQHSVDFHSRSRSFSDSMDLAERVFGDVSIPSDVEEARAAIRQLTEVKKTMLESSMATLQEGNQLLERLRQLVKLGTIDSRPKHLRASVQSACAQVERWLEELHDRRRCLEALFSGRRLILQQCLSLSQLYADLGAVQKRAELIRRELAGSCRLGESPDTSAILLQQHERVEQEAKTVQDAALRLLHTADALVRSGTYARDEPRTRAYAVLEVCTQLIEETDRRRSLLNGAHQFFQHAQQTLERLSVLESNLASAALSDRPRVHAETAAALEEVAAPALSAGNALLDQAGRGTDGTEGVSHCMAELQRRVEGLTSLCTAHKEETLRRTQLYTDFLEKYNTLFGWMVGEAETFLRTHTDLGQSLEPAADCAALHRHMQDDLEAKGAEMESLLGSVPSLREQLEPEMADDLTKKATEMRTQWDSLNALLRSRAELHQPYVKFHQQAGLLEATLEELKTTLSQKDLTEDDIKRVEDKWLKMQQQYHQLSNTGKAFIERAQQSRDPYLDTRRACQCVEATLERLRADQLKITESYERTQLTITRNQQHRRDWENCKTDSRETLQKTEQLRGSLYPILRQTSQSLQQRQRQCDHQTETVVPRLQQSVDQLQQRARAAEKLRDSGDTGGEADGLIKELDNRREEMSTTITDFQKTLQMMTSFFKNLQELDSSIEGHRAACARAPPTEPSQCQQALSEHEATQRAFDQLLRISRSELARTEQTVRQVAPPAAAEHDASQLRDALDTEIGKWEDMWTTRKEQLERQMTSSVFNSELTTINHQLNQLSDQLSTMKGQYGETLREAEQTSRAFAGFEETIANTGNQIQNFVSTAEGFISDSPEPERVSLELQQLQNKWSSFQCQVGDNRKLIDLSIDYYKLVEEAEDWYKEGGKLLVDIARKTTKIRNPEEARRLRTEINLFLSTGQQEQEDRIKRISVMAEELYGTPVPERVVTVTQQHQEMVESLRTVRHELKTLVEKLVEKDEEQESLRRQNTELTETMRIAQQEADAARAAASVAEEARRAAEAAALALQMMPRPVTPLVVPKVDVCTETVTELKKVTVDSSTQDIPVGTSDASTQEQHVGTSDASTQEQHVGTSDASTQDIPVGTSDASTQEQHVGTSDAATQEVSAATSDASTQDIPVGMSDAFTQNTAVATTDAATQERIRVAVVDSGTDAGVPCPWGEQVQEQVSRTNSLQRRTKKTQEPMVPPEFVQPLQDRTVQEGVRHSLQTRVTGHPPPKVNWQKDGISCDANGDYVMSEQGGVCTLTIEETLVEDTATFTCRAWNPAGVSETSGRLTVEEPEPQVPLEPPLFTRHLRPADVKEGRPLQLTASVTGNPLPTVSWAHNGVCVDNSPDYVITYNNGECTLRAEEVLPVDQGTFTCCASNALGTDQTVSKVRVEPLVPAEAPRFTVPLSNAMARAGQKLRLECEVVGLPHPELTWLHNQRPLRESRDTRVTFDGKKATATIVEAFPKDAGTYMIVAKNSAGEATCSCSVTVKGRLPTETSDSEFASDMELMRPVIQADLRDLTVEQGDRAQLDCVLTGQPEPEVIWYHGDQPVKESKDFQLLFHGDRCTLVINKALPDDAGPYSVVAINSAGEATSSCTLNVLAPRTPTPEEVTEEPKFTRLLTDASAKEDEREVLEAEVTGIPEPTVVWLKDGREVKSTESMKITKEGSVVRLEIPSCLPQHSGNYICVATNRAGEARCFSHLVVRPKPAPVQFKPAPKMEPPTFVQIFKDQHVAEGSDVLFQCIIDGKPKPTVQWRFNEGPLPSDSFSSSYEGQHHVLKIHSSKLKDSGRIKCVAENEIGKATCSAHLSVEEPLDLITVPAVTEKRSSSNKAMTMKKTMYTEVHEETQVVNGRKDKKDQETSPSIAKTDDQKVHRSSYEQYRQSDSGQKTVTEQVVLAAPVEKPARPAQPPRYLTPMQGALVKQGDHVQLEGVYTAGSPPPEIKWFKNGVDLVVNDRTVTSSDQSRVSLTLREVTEQDAGRYTCTLSNAAGTATSTADVVVKKTMFPPVFDHRLKAQLTKPGERVFLEATVSGAPTPEVVWKKDGQDIDRQRYSVREEGTRHILVIESATKEDGGKYSIQASNAAGEATSIADVVVAEELPVLVERRLITQDLTEQQYKAALEARSPTSAVRTAPEPVAPPSTAESATPASHPSVAPSPAPAPAPAPSTHQNITTTETTETTETVVKREDTTEAKPEPSTVRPSPPKVSRQQTRSTDTTQVNKEINMVTRRVNVNLEDSGRPEQLVTKVDIQETVPGHPETPQVKQDIISTLSQLAMIPQPSLPDKTIKEDHTDHVQESVTKTQVDRTYFIPKLTPDVPPKPKQKHSEIVEEKSSKTTEHRTYDIPEISAPQPQPIVSKKSDEFKETTTKTTESTRTDLPKPQPPLPAEPQPEAVQRYPAPPVKQPAQPPVPESKPTQPPVPESQPAQLPFPESQPTQPPIPESQPTQHATHSASQTQHTETYTVHVKPAPAAPPPQPQSTALHVDDYVRSSVSDIVQGLKRKEEESLASVPPVKCLEKPQVPQPSQPRSVQSVEHVDLVSSTTSSDQQKTSHVSQPTDSCRRVESTTSQILEETTHNVDRKLTDSSVKYLQKPGDDRPVATQPEPVQRPVFSALQRDTSHDQLTAEQLAQTTVSETVPTHPVVHGQTPMYQFPPTPAAVTPAAVSPAPAPAPAIVPRTKSDLSKQPPAALPQPSPVQQQPTVTYVAHTGPPEHQQYPLVPEVQPSTRSFTSSSVISSQQTITTQQRTVTSQQREEKTDQRREEEYSSKSQADDEKPKSKQPRRRVSDIKRMIENQIEEVESNGSSTEIRGGVCVLPVRTPDVEKSPPRYQTGSTPRETTPTRSHSVAACPMFERFPDLQPFPYKPEPPRPASARPSTRPPPTPTRFVPGTFTDAESSDYDERIPTRWQADGYEYIDRREISVDLPDASPRRPADGTKPPTPPSQFDTPPQIELPPRPKLDSEVVPRATPDRVSHTPEPQKFTKRTPVETPWVPAKKEKVLATPPKPEKVMSPPPVTPEKPVKALVKQWPPPRPVDDEVAETTSRETRSQRSEQSRREVTETVHSKPVWSPAPPAPAPTGQTSTHSTESTMLKKTTALRTQQHQQPLAPSIIQPVAVRPTQPAWDSRQQHSSHASSSSYSSSTTEQKVPTQSLQTQQTMPQMSGALTETRRETSQQFSRTETRFESSSMTTMQRTEVVDAYGRPVVPQPVEQPVPPGGRTMSQSQWSSLSERRETQQMAPPTSPRPIVTSPKPIVTSPCPSSTSSSQFQSASLTSQERQTTRQRPLSSPRPSAEGVSMQKMWSTKKSDKLAKIWPPPASDAGPTAPVWSQEPSNRPMSAMSYGSTQEERSVQETGGYTSDFAGYASEPELAALAARRPEPYIQKPKPPVPQPTPPSHQRTVTQQSMKQMAQKTTTVSKQPPAEPRCDTEERIPAKWTPSGVVEGVFRPVQPPSPAGPAAAPPPADGSRSPTVIQQRGLRPSQVGKSWLPQQQQQLQSSSSTTTTMMRQEYHSQQTVLQQQQAGPTAVTGPRPAPAGGMLAPGAVNVVPLQSPRPTRPIRPKSPLVLRGAPPPSSAFQRFPELEPFPYKPEEVRSKPPRGPPPRMPSKFRKGEMRESDYESDYEGKMVPIWRPADSGDEEPQYRGVRAPVGAPPAPASLPEPEVMGIPLPRPLPAMSPPRHKRPSPPRSSPRRSPSAAQVAPLRPEYPDSGYTADAENTIRRNQRVSTYSETADESFQSQRPVDGDLDLARSESPLSVSSFPGVAGDAPAGPHQRRQESTELAGSAAEHSAVLDSAVAALAGHDVWSRPEPPAPPSELRLAALLPASSRRPAPQQQQQQQQQQSQSMSQHQVFKEETSSQKQVTPEEPVPLQQMSEFQRSMMSSSTMSSSSIITRKQYTEPPEPVLGATLQPPVYSQVSQRQTAEMLTEVTDGSVAHHQRVPPPSTGGERTKQLASKFQQQEQVVTQHAPPERPVETGGIFTSKQSLHKQSRTQTTTTEHYTKSADAHKPVLLPESTAQKTVKHSSEGFFNQVTTENSTGYPASAGPAGPTTTSQISQQMIRQRADRTSHQQRSENASAQPAAPSGQHQPAGYGLRSPAASQDRARSPTPPSQFEVPAPLEGPSSHPTQRSVDSSPSRIPRLSPQMTRKGLVEKSVVEQQARVSRSDGAPSGGGAAAGRNGRADKATKMMRETTKTSSHVSRRVSTERKETTRTTKVGSPSPPRRNSLSRQHLLQQQRKLQEQQELEAKQEQQKLQQQQQRKEQKQTKTVMKQQKQLVQKTTQERKERVSNVETGATTKALGEQLDSMSRQFRSKAQQLSQQVQSDLSTEGAPPATKSVDNGPPHPPTSNGTAQSMAYRNEDRVKDCGTKHTDPGTGLIYFKYDFGYEFGIITPNADGAVGAPAAGKSGSVGLSTAPAPSLTSAGPGGSFTLHSGDIQATVEPLRASGGVTPTPPAQELDGAQLDDMVTSGRLRPESAFGTRTPPNVHISYPQTDAETSEAEADDAGCGGGGRLRGILRRRREPESGQDSGNEASLLTRPPVLLRPLSDVYVRRGESIELRCLVDALPEPQVTWYKDNRVVATAGSVYRAEILNGICRLTVQEAYAEDAGLFRCVATNHLGSVSTEALVCVAGEK